MALAAAAWQHRKFLKDIGIVQAHHVWSISFVVALAVILIGLCYFLRRVAASWAVLAGKGEFNNSDVLSRHAPSSR